MKMSDRGPVPKTKPSLLADYCELLLLNGAYTQLTRADVTAEFQQGIIDHEPDEPVDFSSDAEVMNVDQRHIEDCFSQFEYRQKAFQEFYPFTVNGQVLELQATQSDFHRAYIFLLSCARMLSFEQGARVARASLFERVSQIAMRALAPANTPALIFGANSADRVAYFGTNYKDALRKLGSLLNEYCIDQVIDQQETSGDGGVDLVLVIAFGDGARGCIAFFGQCATSQLDWPKKVLESHPIRIGPMINFLHMPMNLVFIPVLYRQASGAWINEGKLGGSVLLDRLRICAMLRQQQGAFFTSDVFREVSDDAIALQAA